MHRKGTSSLADYIRIFKGYCDDLFVVGKPVGDCQKAFSLLQGLGQGYDSFVTSMLKPPTPSYKEIVPLLQGHGLCEICIIKMGWFHQIQPWPFLVRNNLAASDPIHKKENHMWISPPPAVVSHQQGTPAILRIMAKVS